MRQVPKTVSMNQKEFEKFLADLELWGFDLDANKIKPEYDAIFGIYIDEIEEALSDLIFYDNILAKILDIINGHLNETVYYKSIPIHKDNAKKYRQIISEIVEDKFALVDHNLYVLKSSTGLIPDLN